MRKSIDLIEGWKFVETADGPQDAAASAGQAVSLPHTWNATDGQDGGGDYRRGKGWYVLELKCPQLACGEKAWLEFEGVAMTADVFVAGELVAHHEGGYSTFRADVTGALPAGGTATVVVCADNSKNGTVYPQTADFTFYGGIYRPVRLIVVPAQHFSLGHLGAPGIKVTPVVDLTAGTAEVTVEAWVEGGADAVEFELAGEKVTAPVEAGHAQASVTLAGVHLWNGTTDPHLYTATARLASGDEVSCRFGCRSMEISADGFFLNGRPYPLRGVSRHQDRGGVGNALTQAMHEEDMDLICEMGANAVRLAHYQHAQAFFDLCDERGIVAWAEIPFITMRLGAGDKNAASQLTELITQNYNHPSVCCWALSNEITAATPVDDALVDVHRQLNDLAHELDPTRPTAMAHVFTLPTDSAMCEIADVNAYNLYYGWYVGELEQNDEFFDRFHEQYPDRAIGLTEYGADCNPRFQSESPERGDYTEQYQCLYHEHMLKLIESRPWLWATFVWNMFDFGADGRSGGDRDGQNQKGLVTIDRKLRKDAFYLYKAHWSSDPFVHVCGSRYVKRAGETTKVVVYSNQPQVELLVDGEKIAEQEGRRKFVFEVTLTGSHKISARAGELLDSISVEHVDEPCAEYRLKQEGAVENWFDDDVIDEACYSVKDTMGTLQANPACAAIIAPITEGATKKYGGDVAAQAMNNPMIQQITQRYSLEALLKQAGAADAKTLKALNAALQKIRKEA